MPLDDELPQAPVGATTGEGGPPPANFDPTFDASLLGDVPGMNEPIPQGTYIFRLKKYEKQLDAAHEPRFMVQWSCQQEPYTGRVLMDYVQWVSEATVKAAMNPQAVNCQEARELIRKRMPRAKALMEAAGYKPVGNFNFETDFLATEPEVKIPVTVTERKNKDERREIDGVPNPDFGKYKIPTGQNQNGMPNAYLSVTKPS